MKSADWQFRTVTPETWADMDALFSGRGGPKQCWCMMWRNDNAGSAAPKMPADRKAAMAQLVAAGKAVGLLGYDQGIPVAWCSIAPRASFGKGLGNTVGDDNLWSLTCFYIRADRRKRSGFAALLVAAEAHAAQQGATMIEAYPVDPDSPSYRFSGFLPAFEAFGYVRVSSIGQRRYVVQKVIATPRHN